MGILANLRRAGIPWLGSYLSRYKPIDRYLEREKAKAAPSPLQGLIWFLPYIDSMTGETESMRRAYRQMLRDPAVKAALLSKVFAVASLELHAVSPVPGRAHKRVAAFVEDTLRRAAGGVRAMAESVLLGGLIEGASFSEKIWRYEDRGQWAGKVKLDRLRPKDPEFYRLHLDEFRTITGVLPRFNVTQAPLDPSWFVIWQHLPIYDNPGGMSDLRAAYRAYWLTDTAWKLRAIHLEKYTSPLLLGKYASAASADKDALDRALESAKASTWLTIPDTAQVEALEISQRGTADFQSAILDLRHEIMLGITGAFLQALEGTQTGARSIGEVHQSSAELLVWYLSNCLGSALQTQVVPDLVDLNFAGAEYPDIALGGVNDSELAASLTIDQGLQQMGVALSKRDIYRRYGRTEPEADDPGDKLVAPVQMGSGGFGQPAGGGQSSGLALPFGDGGVGGAWDWALEKANAA